LAAKLECGVASVPQELLNHSLKFWGREKEEVQMLTTRQCNHQLTISLVAAIHNTFGTILLLIPMIDTTHTHTKTRDSLKEII